MRENRPYGSEGGVARAIPTPIHDVVGDGMLGRQCKGSGETRRMCASPAGVRARVVPKACCATTYRCDPVQTDCEKTG